MASPWAFLLTGAVLAAGLVQPISATPDQAAAEANVDREESVDSLRLHITVPESMAPGGIATIVTTVENLTDRLLTLYLPGRTPTVDLVVSDTAGRVLWRKLEGQVLPAILRAEQLEPGGRLTITDRWHATEGPHTTLPPGDYLIRAELLTERGRISTDSVSLRLR